MTKYLLIGVGAFLGANLRYLVGGWAADRLGSTFPYGTLIINVTGSFFLGLLMALVTERFAASPAWRLFFGIGLLGAYTTFSTFTFESLALIQDRAYLAATANLLGSVLLGLLAVVAGVAIGRSF